MKVTFLLKERWQQSPTTIGDSIIFRERAMLVPHSASLTSHYKKERIALKVNALENTFKVCSSN